MRVVGVDGCPGGWLAVTYDPAERNLTPRVFVRFAEILAAFPDAASIGVDIPIGLAVGEPRRCDLEARRLLGPRRSSVFPAPDRRVVTATSYAEALDRARALTGKGISRQAYGIYGRVLEVDRVMTPALQRRVVEVHPEVAFWALAGRTPMAAPKRSAEGFAERRALLAAAFSPTPIPIRAEARRLARPATPDDVLDAIVVAWSALRLAEARAERLPENPSLDPTGLRMEIVF
jgi:predicted RNase H-like nuclease